MFPMKRKIYFFLEQLEINRSERIAVSILMISIIISSGIYYNHEAVANYDPEQYENLYRIFKEKSRQMEQERQSILVRYQPQNEIETIKDPADLNEESTIQQKSANRSVAETEQRMNPEIININTATEEQLVSLPGIGPAYAKRIVEWRVENGLFTEKEQLMEIRGIGERRLEQLIPFIEL